MRYAWAAVTVAVLWAVVGTAMAAPGGSRTAAPITTDCVRVRECPGGDLVADAIRRAASQADAVLVNASQFKAGTIRPGKVTTAEVTALLVQPERTWVISTISGKSLRAALERSLSRVPEESAYFLQVAGLKVVFDPGAPSGRRIKSLHVGHGPVNEATKYRIAMPEDLAKGGSGYFTVPDFTEDNIVTRGGTLESTIGPFLAATPVLDYGRVTRIVAAGEGP
jgi:2',3'-cyclic-nucleotide 2'-phosphodiesterase (5'-nucleotidase family)